MQKLMFLGIVNIFSSKYEVYTLKSFIEYMTMSPIFNSFINDFKREFIINIVGKDNFSNIVKRIHFYYSNPVKKPPSESCSALFKRILFTNTPHPYHYDYCLIHYTENSWNEALSAIKQEFIHNIKKFQANSNEFSFSNSSGSRRIQLSSISSRLSSARYKNQIFPEN